MNFDYEGLKKQYSRLPVIRYIKHPYILLFTCISIALDGYPLFMGVLSNRQSALLLVFILSCAAMPFYPKAGSIVAISCSMLCAYFGIIESALSYYGSCLAFGVLFYTMPEWFALILLLVVGIYNQIIMANYFNESWGTRMALDYLLPQLFPSILGYASRKHQTELKNRERDEALRTMTEQAAHIQRDMSLAKHIHDTLTNDLSYVVTVAQTQLEATNDAEQQQVWNSVRIKAEDAFDRAHEVIDTLRGEQQQTNTPTQQGDWPLQEHLRKIIDLHKAELSNLGYQGTCDISGTPSVLSVAPEIIAETESLIQEIFANIRRHASRDDSFSLHVLFADEALEITEMNTVTTASRGGKSGKGLHMHQIAIESLGGILRAGDDEGIWTLYASIPYAAQTTIDYSPA
jgi:signal transduction histidine kinase